MIIDLYKNMKNYCVSFNAKKAKIFFELIENILRLTKAHRQA